MSKNCWREKLIRNKYKRSVLFKNAVLKTPAPRPAPKLSTVFILYTITLSPRRTPTPQRESHCDSRKTSFSYRYGNPTSVAQKEADSRCTPYILFHSFHTSNDTRYFSVEIILQSTYLALNPSVSHHVRHIRRLQLQLCCLLHSGCSLRCQIRRVCVMSSSMIRDHR